MSRPQALHLAVRAFGVLVSGVIVLVASATALVAWLIVADTIGAHAADVRIPSTARASITVPSATVSVSASATPSTPAATPVPSASPVSPISVSLYRSGGHSYAGIEVLPGTVFRAPFDGTIEVRLYQLINNDVRVGSNVPSLPFFPYVTLVSSDRRLTFRPGALGTDTEVVVRDAQQVSLGTALFRTIGPGRSSWATFYDPSVPFQVVTSLQVVPSGLEIDPLIGYLAD